MKALTYNDLIQAQKEISAHNQQLREQTEQLQEDNRELRSQSLQLVGGGRPSGAHGAGRGAAGGGWPGNGHSVCTLDRQDDRVLVGPDVLPEDGFPRPPLTRLQSGSFREHRGPFLGSQRTREPAGPRALPKALTLSPDVAL